MSGVLTVGKYTFKVVDLVASVDVLLLASKDDKFHIDGIFKYKTFVQRPKEH